MPTVLWPRLCTGWPGGGGRKPPARPTPRNVPARTVGRWGLPASADWARSLTQNKAWARRWSGEGDVRARHGTGLAPGRAVAAAPIQVDVVDDLFRRRAAPLREVLGGVRVLDESGVIAPDHRAVQGREDAAVSLRARYHEPADLALGEHILQVGVLEGVAIALVHDRLGLILPQLGHVLPRLAALRQFVGVVLHPHDRHIRRPGAVNELGDVGHHGVTVMGAADDAVLDVDDEQGGVRAIGQSAHFWDDTRGRRQPELRRRARRTAALPAPISWR